MICAIMQPTYIPWIGYFDIIDKVDEFIFYDNVQLTKRSWQVRNKIKGVNGEIWLTIPISKTKDRDETLIQNAILNKNENWINNHLKSIEFNYKKAKHFHEVYEFLKPMYFNSNFLGEFNIAFIKSISKIIGIKTKFLNSSDLKGISGKKDDRLVQICKTINSTSYLSPQGSASYINENVFGGLFVKNNISLFYHDYNHPKYKQLYKTFIPYIGIFDLLFNEGFSNSLEIIREGRKNNIYYTDL